MHNHRLIDVEQCTVKSPRPCGRRIQYFLAIVSRQRVSYIVSYVLSVDNDREVVPALCLALHSQWLACVRERAVSVCRVLSSDIVEEDPVDIVLRCIQGPACRISGGLACCIVCRVPPVSAVYGQVKSLVSKVNHEPHWADWRNPAVVDIATSPTALGLHVPIKQLGHAFAAIDEKELVRLGACRYRLWKGGEHLGIAVLVNELPLSHLNVRWGSVASLAQDRDLEIPHVGKRALHLMPQRLSCRYHGLF